MAVVPHAVVEGTDLPLKMPIASLDDLALPSTLRANCGTRSPSLLDSYAGPIMLDGRDIALLGASPTGAEQVAPSMADMNELIHDQVIVATLNEITLKNGQPATSIYDRNTCNLHINPSGKFIIGGPQGDAGLTGRKIIIDTYGGWGAHGGGAFSGKDPTKVDRSAAYACRWMAKSVVKAGLCKRALVQLSYAIGVAKPLSLFVETYGSEQGELTAKAITDVVKMEFDARPGALARDLVLREPKYNPTAAYCHFGREPYEKDGMKFFSWENAKDLSKYASMTADQVEAALKGSDYLTKWVD